MLINQEKIRIIEQDGSVLVTANPGTGKTKLLAHKYVDLIKKGLNPEQILCLTFTDKAKRQMETQILKVIKEQNIAIDISNLKVFTFHSYALDCIDDNEIISSNLLRYTIFKFLKDNEVLNYQDDYLIDVIVPKMENLLRYLKSFGVMPDNININEVKVLLEEGNNYSKEEICKFAEDFIEIFKHYEEVKSKKGVDYADLLIKFLKLREVPKFEYVLVDELQDVNILEADIALRSGKNFVAVGDKKQAIFGFQGGSILNFAKFMDSKKFVLSENFRSTNQILSYAREHFVSKTKEESHKEDLVNLKSAINKEGNKPEIYDVQKNNAYSLACELAKGMEGKTAIIARTNYQITDIAKELNARGMDYSTTFFSASGEAKEHIINFLKGVLSFDVRDIKNAMYTPFFPLSLQEAFMLSGKKDLNLDMIYEKAPGFKDIRESVKNVEDINALFSDRIIPVCISYGKDYLNAALTLKNAFQEALSVLPDKDMNSLTAYLQSTDLLSAESNAEKGIILTTVHKAKGREYENVIYLPSKPNNKSNFQDKVVEGILKTKNISAKEELEEESLRIDFVAFTRAENKLIIITEKISEYLNDYAELKTYEEVESISIESNEKQKRAFELFVNKRYDEAKALLENEENWLEPFISNYFTNLERTSFSNLPDKAYEYFTQKILGLSSYSGALTTGLDTHAKAEKILKGESVEEDAYTKNIQEIKKKVTETYPEFVSTEKKIEVTLRDLGFESDLIFSGVIDAVFKNNDEYLILDWKTDKKTDNSAKHRQQLEVYKRMFSAKFGVPQNKISVAIGFIGLRTTINTGVIGYELDTKQPGKTAFDTFSKRVTKLLGWIKEPETFTKDFLSQEVDDNLWRAVREESTK